LGIAASTVGVPLLRKRSSAPPPAAAAGEMPYRSARDAAARRCRWSGWAVTISVVQKDEAESLRIVRTAVDRGINFLDNCWDYNDGVSEVRMGKALRDGYRKKVFLMTKIDGQVKDAGGAAD
jgi:predicted aldo/keto reductase-like oxidoreductase